MSDNAQKSRVVFNGAIPNSPAEKAGMKKGDVILSMNGIAIKDFNNYINAKDSCVNGIQKMDVLRNGALIEVELDFSGASKATPDYNNIVSQLQANGSLPSSEQEEKPANKFYN